VTPNFLCPRKIENYAVAPEVVTAASSGVFEYFQSPKNPLRTLKLINSTNFCVRMHLIKPATCLG